MTGLTDRRSRSVTARLALCAALATFGCSRPNPLFDPTAGGGDADVPSDEPPSDASVRPDRGPLPPPADGPALPTDGPALPGDPMPAPVPDAAPDRRDPDASADSGAAMVAATELVGYWPLDEGTGSTTASDHSGHGNAGTLAMIDASTAWKAGHAGSSLEIPDTVGSGVSVKPSSSLDEVSGGLTISAWVYRITDAKSLNFTVLSRQVGSANREVYSLAFQNDALILWLYMPTNVAEFSLRASRSAPLNAWVHVAATWDGSVVRLYQDGVEVGMGAHAGPLPTSDKPVVLGNNANQTGLDQPLGGRLDEVRLYDRALSAAEIAALAK